MTTASRGVLRPRWPGELASSLYRCIVLVGLTGALPLVGAVVAYFGVSRALSWSAHLSAPQIVRVLAAVGEFAMGMVWTAVAVALVFAAAGRPLSEAARACLLRWTGVRLVVSYRVVPEVTQMATGFWWSGYEYHKTEAEARQRARKGTRSSDPQIQRDAQWFTVAAATILPTTAAPLVTIGVGIALAAASGQVVLGLVLVLAALVAAPFAWRVLGPVAARFLGPDPHGGLEDKVEELEAVRADLTRTQAAELERIERGLHDGTQARLVALGMSMGAAERLVDSDPVTAKAILGEARASSVSALTELRSLVRGINPPVLAERGLVDAVRALALDVPVKVTVSSDVPARLERPVEAAAYFAAAELLANVVKHAHATLVTISLDYSVAQRRLTMSVLDDGVGGAAAAQGSGLGGIERRMAAFGGTVEVESPAGGPTRVTVAVPCALS